MDQSKSTTILKQRIELNEGFRLNYYVIPGTEVLGKDIPLGWSIQHYLPAHTNDGESMGPLFSL
jgi:hypothetical protein